MILIFWVVNDNKFFDFKLIFLCMRNGRKKTEIDFECKMIII